MSTSFGDWAERATFKTGEPPLRARGHPWPPPVGEGRDLLNRQGTPFCQQSGQHANANAIWLAPWLQPWETLNSEPRGAVPRSPGAELWEVGVLSYWAKVILYTAAENWLWQGKTLPQSYILDEVMSSSTRIWSPWWRSPWKTTQLYPRNHRSGCHS